jgi:hypothetical protein
MRITICWIFFREKGLWEFGNNDGKTLRYKSLFVLSLSVFQIRHLEYSLFIIYLNTTFLLCWSRAHLKSGSHIPRSQKKTFTLYTIRTVLLLSYHVTIPKLELRFKTLLIRVLCLRVSGQIFIRTKQRAQVFRMSSYMIGKISQCCSRLPYHSSASL